MQRGTDGESQASAEDMFLRWLLCLPDKANCADAARVEIARIDADPEPDGLSIRLRQFLVLATHNPPALPRHRRGLRH